MTPRAGSSSALVYLTVNDVAEKLNLSKKTITRMIASGKLPGHKIGRSIRIDPHELSLLMHNARLLPSA